MDEVKEIVQKEDLEVTVVNWHTKGSKGSNGEGFNNRII